VRRVIKVGGSLLGDPPRLRDVLARLADGAEGPCVIVPGGGPDADAVRAGQALEGFSDAEAHRRALDAMGRTAERFRAIEGRLVLSDTPWELESSAEQGTGFPSPRSRGEAHRPPVVPVGSARAAAQEDLDKATALVWNPALLRDGHPDIPETWDVTSDSLALWLATRMDAPACILVKSADAPAGASPEDLVRSGLCDAAFPAFARCYRGAIAIRGPAGPPVPVLARRAA
jgi:aspartokinase-like uncharacterized kinase